MRIHQLTIEVANQIAAGEVIERPASVVKELLENALDAHADKIDIDIGFGGLNYISISDNGEGIVPDDLLLSIAPHATSKLKLLSDLSMIDTMGFRGEALASIASVSRLCIQSKAKSESFAMRLDSGDEGVRIVPCARKQGTTIEVRDLFYNASVRKKFLKTEREEYLAIDRVVRRFACSKPGIAISLTHNGKAIFSLPSAPHADLMHSRLQKLLGWSFVDNAVFLTETSGSMRLEGWVVQPPFTKSQHDKQWIYINQRMVNDKLILNAIKQAYAPFLHPGRYPVCLLYFTMPSEDLDVNVHPAKHEVRFHNPRSVHDFIRCSIASVLGVVPEEKRVSVPLLTHLSKQMVDTYVIKSNHWFILNQTCAVVKKEQVPYLVDFSLVEQYRIQQRIKTEALPWASRPLLVPVFFKLTDALMRGFDKIREQCLSYGLMLDVVDDNGTRVRAIPLCFPRLDLVRFFAYLNESKVDLIDVSLVFLLSQSFNLLALNEEEMNDYMTYWEHHYLELQSFGRVAAPFSEHHCQVMLNAHTSE